jgi:peptide chain release factor subunit 1
MATTVTDDLLRDLAGFHARNGCALSIYLDLDPSVAPTTPDIDTRFRAHLAEAEKLGEARSRERDCRLALRRDAERIRSWWDDGFDRDGARGVAIFASSADGYFRALPLAERVNDAVRVGPELHLTPLVDQFGHDGTLVAVVSRERGTVYRIRNGRLEEIVDETEEQPGQHDQGGWSQARYQRHIEHLVQQHLKTVGGEIDRRLRGPAGLQMVVVMPEEMRSAFAAKLSTEAREAIVGWASAEAHAGPAALMRVVKPILGEADARRHEGALERWREERGPGGRASSGWQETLDAAADARVDVLLLAERVQRTVWQCPECGRAYVANGACPIDGSALTERDDGADVVTHQVLAQGGSVLRLGQDALRDAEGIGALLRF